MGKNENNPEIDVDIETVKADIVNEIESDVVDAKSENTEISEPINENSSSPLAGVRNDSDTECIAKRRASWFIRDIFEWGEVLVSAVVIIVTVFTFVVRVTSVDGSSMSPTLFNQDQMLVTNFFYTPSRGDIVVVYAPELFCNDDGDYGKDVIKRVIAVGGDTVRIDSYSDADSSGRVYVNGEPLESISVDGESLDVIGDGVEFYENGYFVRGRTHSRFATIDIEIPEGYVFVLGDNRGNSVDSRGIANQNPGHQGTIGLVNINHIAGRAFFRVAGSSGGDEYSTPWSRIFSAFGFVQ
ncbi:MAG: signal peptidase I [Oscillospiraceae bacterium]|nr:signal peptidase I [Oscillospiraceae bacterium]